MDPVPDFTTAVRAEFARARDLFDGHHVLVAVSGGPDSMALLHLLASERVTITAAHFDHRLRDDSHRDRERVEAYCERHDIPCHTGKGDVAARARSHRESIEAAARHLRYAFLEETADAIGAGRIATGHTRDDQIETILMRIARGSGIRGLPGIPRQRGRIVRPVLMLHRSQLVGYCNAMSVPWVEDPSNHDITFERNTVRHTVLPALARGVADLDRRLLAVAEEAARRVATVRDVTEGLLDEHLTEEAPGVWVLPVPPLRSLDPTATYVLFGDLLSYRIGHTHEPGRVHYDGLFRLLRRPGASLSLPGMTVRREHDHLVFRRGDAPAVASELPVTLALPGRATRGTRRLQSREFRRDDAENGSWRAYSNPEFKSGGDLTFAVAYFARERVTPPFVARSAEPGDSMRPFGMGGHTKKLSDIFIDNKIPARMRGGIPVIEDTRRIIWLAGVTTSEATRVTSDTRDVVELKMTIE